MKVKDLRQADHLADAVYATDGRYNDITHFVKQPKENKFKSGITFINRSHDPDTKALIFSLTPEGKLQVQFPMKKDGIAHPKSAELDLTIPKDKILHIGRTNLTATDKNIFGILEKVDEENLNFHIYQLERNKLVKNSTFQIKDVTNVYQFDWGTIVEKGGYDKLLVLPRVGLETRSKKLSPESLYNRLVQTIARDPIKYQNIIGGGEAGTRFPLIITEDPVQGRFIHVIMYDRQRASSGNIDTQTIKLEGTQDLDLPKPIQAIGRYRNGENRKSAWNLNLDLAIKREDGSLYKFSVGLRKKDIDVSPRGAQYKILDNVKYIQPLDIIGSHMMATKDGSLFYTHLDRDEHPNYSNAIDLDVAQKNKIPPTYKANLSDINTIIKVTDHADWINFFTYYGLGEDNIPIPLKSFLSTPLTDFTYKMHINDMKIAQLQDINKNTLFNFSSKYFIGMLKQVCK